MITIDPDVIIRGAVLALFGGGGFGGAFAFLRPFASQTIQHRIDRMRRLAEIDDEARRAKLRTENDKDGALSRIAVNHERIVGVLEAMDERHAREEARRERTDARLFRIETHLGISPTPSAAPDEPAGVHLQPRRALTDPDLRPALATLPEPVPSRPATPPPGK